MKCRASQYQSIQHQSILTGKLIPGERLPSTRTLAESLGISRGTVKLGYEQLLNEGYLETVNGSGTFVCQQISDQSLPAIPLQRGCNGTLITTGLSQYAQNFVTSSLYLGSSRRGEFLLGYANLDEKKIDQGIHRLAQVLGE